jgi:hypothetical protein
VTISVITKVVYREIKFMPKGVYDRSKVRKKTKAQRQAEANAKATGRNPRKSDKRISPFRFKFVNIKLGYLPHYREYLMQRGYLTDSGHCPLDGRWAEPSDLALDYFTWLIRERQFHFKDLPSLEEYGAAIQGKVPEDDVDDEVGKTDLVDSDQLKSDGS